LKEVRTEIELKASPERVWQVFTDLASFRDWNPFIKEAEGELKVGSKLRIVLYPPGGLRMELRPEVLSVVANMEVSWRGRIPGVFTGEHRFTMKRTGDNGTRFIQRSTFAGLATRLFRGDFVEGMRWGFEAMEVALKERVEKTAGPNFPPDPDAIRTFGLSARKSEPGPLPARRALSLRHAAAAEKKRGALRSELLLDLAARLLDVVGALLNGDLNVLSGLLHVATCLLQVGLRFALLAGSCHARLDIAS
jgi:hypothetical protein